MAKPMPHALRNQVGDILSTSAEITVTGPLISAYLCEANSHAELRIDNFFETPDERRHIGPAKLVVASTGPLTIRIEFTEVGSPMQVDLDVALGNAALVFGELVPYRIMAAHPYIIVHAFF
ncbi:MAG TPA: hypothetical protein VGV14_02775 [Rhodanobacter sp.]|nr:hypothetical protein [Rhodanobacter sp.]